MRPLLGKYFTVVVKVMQWAADPVAAARAAAEAAAAAAAAAAAGALGLGATSNNPELIDPQTEVISKLPVTEDATRVYQPISSSQGSFGYVLVDSTSPAQYQIDNKNTLWKLILAAGFLVMTTGTLYQTYSI